MEKGNSIYDLIRRGDKRAFEDLYRKYYPVLCELSKAITHSHETAEEIVDDLFFSIWDHRETFSPVSLDSYLFQSIRNNSKKACMSQSFRKKDRTSSIEELYIQIDNYLTDDAHPLGWLLEKEMEKAYNHALDSLSPECRRVFELSRVQGMTYKEIAEKLGISVNTVKYHMKQAIKILTEKLSPVLFLLPFQKIFSISPTLF
ncbi:DNA-directed RNA polymerase sigma-70 factor [Hallella multisaccharivorax DSM 17128]|nr:RNA polymerase sigma-70 factor [Hallella multisaccharivorax]GJG29999.1 DNA-directed RNA polymerase sigma-70 factor [Hallella multisaccharivorax DSM 17128]